MSETNGAKKVMTRDELRKRIAAVLRERGIDDFQLECDLAAVLYREQDGAVTVRPAHTAQSVVDGLAKAISQGASKTELSKEGIEKAFRKNYLWSSKWVKDVFLPFLRRETEAGREIDRFARWWWENDWRGKQGQSPTLQQIYENWPQAFPQVSVSNSGDMRVTVGTRGELFINGRYYESTNEFANGIECIGHTREGKPVYSYSDDSVVFNGILYNLNPNMF